MRRWTHAEKSKIYIGESILGSRFREPTWIERGTDITRNTQIQILNKTLQTIQYRQRIKQRPATN
ncbi:hypothetical protein AOLI_G00184170 [Acnodon oligacanthus]